MGTFSVIPSSSNPFPDEAYSETSTATGTETFLDLFSQNVAGYNDFSNLPDGAHVDCIISTFGNAAREIGTYTYDAVNDVLIRNFVQWSTVGVGSPIDLPPPNPGQPATVIGQSVTDPAPQFFGPETEARLAREAQALIDFENRELLGVQRNMSSVLGSNYFGMSKGPLAVDVALRGRVVLVTPELYLQFMNEYMLAGGAGADFGEICRSITSVNDVVAIRPTLGAQQGGLVVFVAKNHTRAQLLQLQAQMIIEGGWFFPTVADKTKMLALKNARYAVILPCKGTPIFITANWVTAINPTLLSKLPLRPIIDLSAKGITNFLSANLVGILGAAAILYETYQFGTIIITKSADLFVSNKIRLVQGRLQVNTTLSEVDRDRRGFCSRIFFVPVMQTEPLRARVTLFRPLDASITATRIHWPIVTTNGLCPSLDVTQPSARPFHFNPAKMHNLAFDPIGNSTGIPADIFMCWPTNSVVSPNTDLPEPSAAANRLPRLFHINWYNATSRNNGQPLGPDRRGFDLVNTDTVAFADHMGMCLNAKSVSDGGFIVNDFVTPGISRRDDPKFYLYLGTVLVIDGQVINMPGCRLLWNMYNRMGYNDFLAQNPGLIFMNRRAINGFKSYLSTQVINSCSHKFVDPTDGSHQIPTISNQAIGVFSTSIVGPISIDVRHVQRDVRLIYATNTSAHVTGATNCTPLNVEMTNLRLPAPFTPYPGFNEIVAYQTLESATDCSHKSFAYVGSTGDLGLISIPNFTGKFYYRANYGFILARPGAVSPDDPAPNDCINKTRGFGFIGNC